MLAVSGAALLLCGVYFIGLQRPDWVLPNPGIVPSLALALQFLAFGLGPATLGFGAAGIMVLAAGLLLPAVLYGWTGNLEQLAGWWQIVSSSTAPNLLGADNITFNLSI